MPEIEPLEALTLSLHHNRGAYALLVGSGLSRAAGIPTGWEITLDLVKRLGAIRGVKDHADWGTWYQEQFNEAPNYSAVLDSLSATPAERRSILHGYIEPQEGEETRRPTKAHRSIAQLVLQGVIRVIVTTNFDKLIETALREAGIEPTVIASEDALIGATPLTHSACTVIKLHGDYLDARIKNTDTELGSYPAPVDKLLDEVFDRFGLVVVGWSGEWDTALRSAILRTPSRRYALYWAARGKPASLAQDIIEQRRGRVVPITDADTFFNRLGDTLDALRSAERPHPQSTALAVALAKKYCRNDEYALEWTELLAAEVEKIRKFVNSTDYMPRLATDAENVTWLVQQFVDRSEILRSLALIAGRWGTTQAVQAVIRATSLLASWPPIGGIVVWLDFRSFAATLCFYWTLIGLLARDEFQSIKLQMHARGRTSEGEVALVTRLPPLALLGGDVWKQLKGYEKRRLGGSDLLLKLLKTDGHLVTLTDEEVEDLFDRLEFLISLEFAQLRLSVADKYFWTPLGIYTWNTGSLTRQRTWLQKTVPNLLHAGLLGGTEASANKTLSTVDEFLKKIPNY